MHPKNKQRGVVLIICLILLTVATLTATTGLENTILEERMAGNLQNYSLAFQAAEAALNEAEQWLAGQQTLPAVVTASTNNIDVWNTTSLEATAGLPHWWQTLTAQWWSANGENVTGLTPLVAANPQFIIEQLAASTRSQSLIPEPDAPPPQYFIHRITATGTGGNSKVVVYLQSTYGSVYSSNGSAGVAELMQLNPNSPVFGRQSWRQLRY